MRAAELSVLAAHRPPLDPVLLVGLALVSAQLSYSAPLATFTVFSIASLLIVCARRRGLALVAAGVFAVGALRAHGTVARHEDARKAIVLSGPWPERCTASGVISRSPVLLGDSLRFDVEATAVQCGDRRPLAGRVTLHVPSSAPGDLARGDLVEAVATLAPPSRFFNDGASDPRPSSARRGVLLSGGAEDLVRTQRAWGVPAWVDRARAHVRTRILATYSPEIAPMARALVLGEDDLASSDHEAFRRSGLAHLLAVSGMHLVLVVMGVVSIQDVLFRRFLPLSERMCVRRLAAATGLPIAWAYAAFAGASGSAVRAAWMCTVVLLSEVLDRRASPVRALGLSVLVMAVVDPVVAYDISFVLSALATIGLLALSRNIVEYIERSSPLRSRATSWISLPVATTLSATIACAPVLAMLSPELPLGGLVANIVAVPLGEAAALPLCLAHALLGWWPQAEHGAAAAASGALWLVRTLAKVFAAGVVPVPVPTPEQLAAIAVTAFTISLVGRARALLSTGAFALALLEGMTRIEGAPGSRLRVTFLDVGQGDAALIDLPDGSAMLVDGGGLVGSPMDVGERLVAPLLAARRRSHLVAIVLSHPHPDHYLGLGAVLANVRADAFWDTGQGEAEGMGNAYAVLLSRARANQIPVLRPEDLCGTKTLGGATIDILAPCPSATSDRGPNNNSFVLRVRYGRRAVLFMGDAEREQEAELVRTHARTGMLSADVLKVGHHGSRTSSTPALLTSVRPSLAVVSCGVRNRFGHPHQTTLDALAEARVRVLRTDRHGSVVVTTDGESLEVRTALRDP